MPTLQNYSAFARMTEFCKTRVPSEVREALQPIMSDDEAVKDYGVALGIKMCKDLTEAGVPGEFFVRIFFVDFLVLFCVFLFLLRFGSAQRWKEERPQVGLVSCKRSIFPRFMCIDALSAG